MTVIDRLKSAWAGLTGNTPQPEAYTFGYPPRNSPYGNSLSGGAKWPNGLSNDGGGHIIDHYRSRQNARTAYHDVPQAKALVDRYADTVADVGLMLEPDPNAELLGISQDEKEKWREDVAARFHLWAKSKNSDLSRTNNLYQNMYLYQIQQHRDGEVFTRLFYTKEADSLNPLQIQFLDADQIRGDAFTSTYGFNFSNSNAVDGIYRDDRGRETGYKISTQKSDGTFDFVDVQKIGGRSGRVFMLHGYRPEYAGQGRGYSRLAHALQEFQNITDFTSAQIMKAINQSSIAMSVESNSDNPVNNPLQGMSVIPAGPRVTPVTGTGTETIEQQAELSATYTPIPDAESRAPGSIGVFSMNGKEKLVPFANTAPSDSFESFTNSFLTYLAASNSMPLEVLLMKFDASYSAARGALILFWRVAQIWRNEMISDFLDPIYCAWLSGEIAAGTIKAPGWSDPLLRAAWLNCKWEGAPMPNIDPMRTAKADEAYLQMGATNQETIARNHNGSSAKVNIAKNNKLFPQTPVEPWNVKQQGITK